MKLRYLISSITIAFLQVVSLNAQTVSDRLSFGLEWGISDSFFALYDYNYRTLEDFRAGKSFKTFESHLNGSVTGFVGVNLSRRLNLGLYSGYQGLTAKVRIIPVELKMKYFTGRNPRISGWLLTAGGGAGFCPSGKSPCSNLAEAGFGRRFYVGCGVSMDMTFTLIGGYSHPEVYNNYDDVVVDEDHLDKSDKLSLAAALKMSLNF